MTTTITSKAARTSVLIALGIGLAACGSDDASSGNGDYFAEDSDDLTSVVIDGDKLTYTRMQCEGENQGTSVGELNDERNLVVWLEEGRFEGDDTVTFTESSVTISSNDANPSKWDEPDTFTRQDAGESKSQFDQQCADAAAEKQERETKRQDEASAAETERAEIRTKLDSMTEAEMAECLGMPQDKFDIIRDEIERGAASPEQAEEGLASMFQQSGCLDN
ncbi:hypothetical protein [Nostocoides vanveenii]|uniref:Uncharacterized protein n=1 Tax=Nostocoides vanveenii TaxID=330835 RepID=A0ABP4X6T7_9MICO